jgi:tRNA-guanine family transglycosylase
MTLKLKQIHTCQEINADIAVPLDFICHDRLTNEEKEFRQQATIENAKIALEMRKRKEMQIYASIQGWDSDSLALTANELGRLPFDGYALGGMVPHANDPEFIARAVKIVRNYLPPEKPLHIFGITSPIMMPILYAAGVTTVDSASYAISAANRQYLLPNFLKHVDLRRLQTLPCRCNICSDNSKEYLQGAGSKPIAFLAMHNLNIVFDHLKIIRCLKSLNKLEEYAAIVATASPEYTEAFKILIGKRPSVSYEDFNFNQFSLSDFEQ